MLTETIEYRKKSQAQVTWFPATCGLGMRLGSHTTQDPEILSAFTYS